MTWRYDVFACNNETDDHSTCEVMTGPPVDILWNGRWKDAYRKAESLPHAVVETRYMGDQDWNKTPHIVFEHIEGGDFCWQCLKERGPLCKTANGNKFVCAGCQATMRRSIEQTARDLGIDPDRWSYVPIIDTLDFEAR